MLHFLIHNQLYFLVLAHDNFDGFIIGEAALFKNFFNAQVDDIKSLSASRHEEVFQYLYKQVFGSDLEDEREEIERQAAFNREKQRELAGSVQEESDIGEHGSQKMNKEDGEGEGEGDKSEGSQRK